ncbi:kremen protein 1-like [Glandiceps talaboti]
MTIAKCLENCRDHVFAALRGRNECRCGEREPNATYNMVTNDKCSETCNGRNDQACGGQSTSAVYRTSLGACGGNLFQDEGWIFSPNFPDEYQSGDICRWTITASRCQVFNVTLQMLDLDPFIRPKNGQDEILFFGIQGFGDTPMKITKEILRASQ